MAHGDQSPSITPQFPPKNLADQMDDGSLTLDFDLNDPTTVDGSNSTILVGKYKGYGIKSDGSVITLFPPQTTENSSIDNNQLTENSSINNNQLQSIDHFMQQQPSQSSCSCTLSMLLNAIQAFRQDVGNRLDRLSERVTDLETKIDDDLDLGGENKVLTSKIFEHTSNINRFFGDFLKTKKTQSSDGNEPC